MRGFSVPRPAWSSDPQLAGIGAVVVLQTVYAGLMINGTFFFGDDFINFDVAREMGLSWAYLKRSLFGHLEPGHRFGNWAVLHWFDASRGAVVVIELVLFAISTILLARLLRLLVGRSPWVPVLLLFYAFSPAVATALVWWSAALNALPGTIFGILVVDCSIRWWADRRWGWGLGAVLSLAVGMTFYEKISYLPLVAALIIVGWRTEGSAKARVVELVRRGWPLAVGFLVPLVTYWSYFSYLGYSREITQKATPGQLVDYLGYAWAQGFVPLLFGVATTVETIGSQATTAVLSGAIVLVLVVLSVRGHRQAWLGWALLVTIFLLNSAQVGIARAARDGASYGRDTKYFGDFAWLVVVCLVLIVATRTPREPGARRAIPTALVLVVVGAFWVVNDVTSVHRLHSSGPGPIADEVHTNLSRSWDRWRTVDPSVSMVDSYVRGEVLEPLFFPYDRISKSLGPYLTKPAFDSGTTRLVMRSDGTLVPATELRPIAAAVREHVKYSGTVTVDGDGLGCAHGGAQGGRVVFDLDQPVGPGSWFLDLGITGSHPRTSVFVWITRPDGATIEGRSYVSKGAYQPLRLSPEGSTVVALAPNDGFTAAGVGIPANTTLCFSSVTADLMPS